jgi:hypothetical protein
LFGVRTSVGHRHGCVGRPLDADTDSMPFATLPGGRLWRMAWRTTTPTVGQSGRPLANSHCERVDGQTHLTDVFQTRFSRKTSKVTTLIKGGREGGPVLYGAANSVKRASRDLPDGPHDQLAALTYGQSL